MHKSYEVRYFADFLRQPVSQCYYLASNLTRTVFIYSIVSGATF